MVGFRYAAQMVRPLSDSPDFSARFSFWLLAALLVVLWFAGGASRADVAGQSITRFFAWASLIAYVLTSSPFDWRRVKPVFVLLVCSILLVLLQLVPLPPAIWTALPGRALLTGAAEVSGQAQPWRPLSVSPSGTVNALGSLVVPACALVLAANLTKGQHWRIGGLLLALIFAGCLLAMLQFAGVEYDNPLINYQAGTISGNFANRNHFALFVALGCLIAPVWGFKGGLQSNWKALASISLLPFFLLVILATGSRMGLALAGVAILTGLFIVWPNIFQVLQSWPRRRVYSIVATTLLALVGLVALSFQLDRAIALDRTLDLRVTDDLRSQALPFVIDAIARYFPAGAGFGTFDPVFRIGEPDALLQPAYWNHAHNDWLEVILDGGVLGAALMVGAVVWAISAARRAGWNKREGATLGRVGMAALLLVMLASVADYPARTPMWMAIIVIAALWLHSGSRSSAGSPADATPP